MAPEEIQRSWKSLMSSIIHFNQLKIPRWIGYRNTITAAKIRVFGDSPGANYGAVAYARLQKINEDPYFVLLTSKTKVKPLPNRKVTLPILKL